MNDPAILFVKPKAISSKDKKALQTAGILVIEVDDPANVKFMRAGYELESGALLRAAAKAIEKTPPGYDVRKEFALAVCAAISAKDSTPCPPHAL